MPAIITKEQFEVVSNLKVRHVPSGWEFSTYAYDDPADVRIVHEHVGTDDFEVANLRAVALAMLQALAKRGTA